MGFPHKGCLRGLLVALALASVSTGCTTASRATADSFRLLFDRGVKPDAAQVAANRFPQAFIRTPDLSSIMVLGYVDDGRQVWYASDHAVFELDARGLVLSTSGMGRSLQSRIIGTSPFDDLRRVDGPVTIQREYDERPAYRFGVSVTGTLVRSGREEVEILGRRMSLDRFDETLQGGLRGRNTYWADPATGFIWKSQQLLAPGYELEVVQLKPYRPAGA